jgi:hypothetical protein
MLNQAFNVTLRILLFRAGPQDFPYSPALVPWLPAVATLAYYLLFTVAIPSGVSLLLSALSVAALAFVTHSLLSARRVANRFQQTFHALLATSIPLNLASIPPMHALAPALQQIAANPELLQQPGAVEVSPFASLALNLLNFWNLAVYAHIVRHAADTRILTGVLIALFALFSALLLAIVGAQLLLSLLKLA